MVTTFLLLVFLATFVIAGIVVAVGRVILLKRAGGNAEADALGSLLSQDSPVLLKPELLSTISVWHSLLARFDYTKTMKARIAEADLNWSVGRLTLAMLLCGAVALGILINIDWIPLWACLGAGVGGGMTPYLFVLRRRARRLRRFQEQFPDGLDFLARSMGAGHPFPTSLDMLANDSELPLAAEMRKVSDEHKLGLPWERAFENLACRIPVVEVSLFAAAVQLHNRSGGKLNEVLSKLADTMRDSVSLQGEVRSISAHGRMTGLVLTMLPLFVVAMMMVVNPGYYLVLLRHPHGKDMIAGAIFCLGLAQVAIRRIVDIRI